LTNREDARIGLLRSIDEAVSLFQRLQTDVKETKELDLKLCTNLQREILKLTAAVQGFQADAQTDPVEDRVKKTTLNFEEVPHGLRKPDYIHWARLAYWTDYDAVALAAGCDPELVDWTESNRLLEWVRAAVQQGVLHEPISPAAFVDWFDRLNDSDVTLPEELRQAIMDHRSVFFGETKATDPRDPVDTRSAAPTSESDQPIIKKGSEKRVWETTQILLVHFMRSSGAIEISEGDPPAVSWSAARDFAELNSIGRSGDAVQTHLNNALKAVRNLELKKVSRNPRQN
jgi:hypothetical protein